MHRNDYSRVKITIPSGFLNYSFRAWSNGSVVKNTGGSKDPDLIPRTHVVAYNCPHF